MTNVLYHTGKLKEYISVAKKMKNLHGWDPKYWVAQDLKEEIRAIFPDVIYHDRSYAFRGKLPPGYDAQYPLDASLLKEHRHHETIILHMMSRYDTGYTFEHDERVRHYHRLLSFYEHLVGEISPDYAVFSTPPHMVSDFVLYSVCQRRDIKTIMFIQTKRGGLVFTRTNIFNQPEKLHELNCKTSLPERLKKEVDKLRVDQGSLTPKETADLWTGGVVEKNKSKIKNIDEWPYYAQKILFKIATLHKPITNIDANLNKRGKTLENSNYTRYEYLIYKLKSTYTKRKLRQYYESHAQPADFSKQYVYFPLHYQPERTTCPDGGIYSYQYLVAQLLSESIPDELKLYIKEHPTQFSDSRQGERGRRQYHYDDLRSINSVELIQSGVSSRELIDNSEFVATVTGTAGWEAVARENPAIIFGNAWYRGCEGVFYVKTRSDLDTAIKSIQNGYTPPQDAPERFLSNLYEIGFIGYTSPSGPDRVDWVSRQENVERIYDELSSYASQSTDSAC